MKTIMSLMLVMLISFTTATTKKDRFHLTLGGKFIAEKHVTYELYKVHKDKTMSLEHSSKGNKYFCVQVDVGETYVLKFITKSGKVKYLNLEALCSGKFDIDVDFRNDTSAFLAYNGRAGYLLVPFETDKVCYVKR